MLSQAQQAIIEGMCHTLREYQHTTTNYVLISNSSLVSIPFYTITIELFLRFVYLVVLVVHIQRHRQRTKIKSILTLGHHFSTLQTVVILNLLSLTDIEQVLQCLHNNRKVNNLPASLTFALASKSKFSAYRKRKRVKLNQ